MELRLKLVGGGLVGIGLCLYDKGEVELKVGTQSTDEDLCRDCYSKCVRNFTIFIRMLEGRLIFFFFWDYWPSSIFRTEVLRYGSPT